MYSSSTCEGGIIMAKAYFNEELVTFKVAKPRDPAGARLAPIVIIEVVCHSLRGSSLTFHDVAILLYSS
jgi:hypothetical protein